MRAGLLAVTLLVVLAGCQGGLSTTPDQTVTVTPAPYVPVPGLSVSGIEAVETLAAAHVRTLEGRSYTVTMNLTIRGPEGTVRGGTTMTIQVGPDHERFWLRTHPFGEFPFDGTTQPPVEAWSNGTTTYLRRIHAARTVYRAYDTADTGWDKAPPNGRTIQTYLGVEGRDNVTMSGDSGARGYRLRIASRNRTTVARIAPSGLVREFTAIRPASAFLHRDIGGSATYRVRYADIGATNVTRPGWVADAVRVTRNQSYVGQG